MSEAVFNHITPKTIPINRNILPHAGRDARLISSRTCQGDSQGVNPLSAAPEAWLHTHRIAKPFVCNTFVLHKWLATYRSCTVCHVGFYDAWRTFNPLNWQSLLRFVRRMHHAKRGWQASNCPPVYTIIAQLHWCAATVITSICWEWV